MIAITGTGSGFGEAICLESSNRGFRTLSIGRSHSKVSDFQITVDLADPVAVSRAAREMVKFEFGILILNAFKFGAVRAAQAIEVNEMRANLQVNLYAQKELIDSSLRSGRIEEVIAISSGAANNGYAHWLHYCLGKASLDAMMRVYAEEVTTVKFWSASPGVLAGDLNQALLAIDGDFSWKEKLRINTSSSSSMASSLLDLLDSPNPSSGEWIRL